MSCLCRELCLELDGQGEDVEEIPYWSLAIARNELYAEQHGYPTQMGAFLLGLLYISIYVFHIEIAKLNRIITQSRLPMMFIVRSLI